VRRKNDAWKNSDFAERLFKEFDLDPVLPKSRASVVLKGNPRGICIQSLVYVCSGCVREADLENKRRMFTYVIDPYGGESIRYIGSHSFEGLGERVYVCSRCGKTF
jgi:DNA-directed RNA polymerase subunit RPC12/RpoP